jgi:hypothetical protein
MDDIEKIWSSKDESVWSAALKDYWDYVQTQGKTAIEEEMACLDVEALKGLSDTGWRSFLAGKFFPWKYSPGRYYQTQRAKFLRRYSDQTELKALLDIKGRIFKSNLEVAIAAISVVREIHQIGIAGSSALLSLLFPRQFGTVDKFVIKSLQRIEEFKNDPVMQQTDPDDIRMSAAARVISIMRCKAAGNNVLFQSDKWTSRKIDMVLWVKRESKGVSRSSKTTKKEKLMDNSRPPAWSIADEVARSLTQGKNDNLIRFSEFSTAMKQQGYAGVQASDYVHGESNRDPRSGKHPIFEKSGRGIYRYVGPRE